MKRNWHYHKQEKAICVNCGKEFIKSSWNAKSCSKKCNDHYQSHLQYVKIAKTKNNEIAREYRKNKHEKLLKENLSKKRELGFPDNVDYEKPFTKVDDGFGYMGVLLCDKKTGQIQCHVCGGWYDWLQNHILGTHKMKGDEYREKFGLKYQTALCSEKVRDSLVRRAMTFPWERMHKQGKMLVKMSRSGAIHNSKKWRSHNARRDAEYKNEKGTCHLQIIDKLMRFSQKLGRQPNSVEITKKNVGIARSTVERRFGSMKEVRRILEMQGYKYEQRKGIPISDDALIDALRKFESVYKRRPAISDINRGLLPYGQGAYQSHFGKWSIAISKAFGADYFAFQHKNLVNGLYI